MTAAANPLAGLPRPLAIAAYDAGAANIILSWVAALDEPAGIRLHLAGPAAALWAARGGAAQPAITPAALLDGAATLVSGTGWASSLEHDARVAAAAAGVASIAVIDHWVNYAMRFERGGRVQLPGAIWVTDDEAAAIAAVALPGVPLAVQPNFYLAEQVAAAGPPPPSGALLFVAEPARSQWGQQQEGEFQALDYLIAHRAAAGVPESAPLLLRPHPSDPPGKYAAWLAANPGTSLDMATDLAKAMRASRWVAGMNSFALVVALAAGRQVLSCLPPWAPPCVLPHGGIMHLKDVAFR